MCCSLFISNMWMMPWCIFVHWPGYLFAQHWQRIMPKCDLLQSPEYMTMHVGLHFNRLDNNYCSNLPTYLLQLRAISPNNGQTGGTLRRQRNARLTFLCFNEVGIIKTPIEFTGKHRVQYLLWRISRLSIRHAWRIPLRYVSLWVKEIPA